MEKLPNEILHMVCSYAGYKATFQLCCTCKDLNTRLKEDELLWAKFVDFRWGKVLKTNTGANIVRSWTKEKFLDFLCFDLWLDDAVLDRTDKHRCRNRVDL